MSAHQIFETINAATSKLIENGERPQKLFISINLLDELNRYYISVKALKPLEDRFKREEIMGLQFYKVLDDDVIQVV